MQIYGFQKTTLLDFPRHLAATVFTGGCNFRCPFCHNKSLVLPELLKEHSPAFTEQNVLAYLKKRRPVLEGVCITGGEPALQPNLIRFIRILKEYGYRVKLDTNGYLPAVLSTLLNESLLDYIAMDIKTSPEHYSEVSGLPSLLIEPITQSVDLIMRGTIPYEFRTTVVKELHTDSDFRSIASWIAGCDSYYLQNFRENDMVIQTGFSPCTEAELNHFRQLLLPLVPNTYLRGINTA